MLAGIIEIESNQYSPEVRKYERILAYNGVQCVRLSIHEAGFWDRLGNLDLLIYVAQEYTLVKEVARSVLPVIDQCSQVKCIPDMPTFWPYDDRIKSYYLLRQAGAPIPDTSIFWHRSRALEWIKHASMPLVFKLRAGSGAQNSIIIRSRKQAEMLVRRMFGKGGSTGSTPLYTCQKFKTYPDQMLKNISSELQYIISEASESIWDRHKNYVLFQQYIPDRIFETRILVIGNRAFLLRSHDGDYPTSGRQEDNSPLERKSIEMALTVARQLKAQYTTFIFVFDEKKQPYITDLTFAIPSDADVLEGYWDHELRWHHGPFWPQYFCLLDQMNVPGLKHPDIS
ncbi:MAG: hypothetical protein ACP5D1_06320 [Bacteroidales bacterium]